MHSIIKSTFKIAVAIGFFVLPVNDAFAQSAGNNFGGNISMGSNGPVASFGTSLPGTTSVFGGNQGFSGPTQNSGFQFSNVTDTGNRAVGGPLGPQGQRTQGYGFGVGSGFFGPSGTGARNSQGATGAQSRESITTQGNHYGNNQKTNRLQGWQRNGGVYQETNLLSNDRSASNIFAQQAVPSGEHDYGFRTGAGAWGGTASQFLRSGWYLPPTSTSSLDIDIVDK